MISFQLPYPPSTNRMYRRGGFQTYLSAEARQYKRDVALIVGSLLPEPLQGDVRLAVDVYRPRKAGDLDNRLKAILDGLIGVAFEDDDQVIDIRARRFDQPKEKGVKREGYVLVVVEAVNHVE